MNKKKPFQVDLLKDQLEDMEEQLLELQRQHKDRCRVSAIWESYCLINEIYIASQTCSLAECVTSDFCRSWKQRNEITMTYRKSVHFTSRRFFWGMNWLR